MPGDRSAECAWKLTTCCSATRGLPTRQACGNIQVTCNMYCNSICTCIEWNILYINLALGTHTKSANTVLWATFSLLHAIMFAQIFPSSRHLSLFQATPLPNPFGIKEPGDVDSDPASIIGMPQLTLVLYTDKFDTYVGLRHYCYCGSSVVIRTIYLIIGECSNWMNNWKDKIVL